MKIKNLLLAAILVPGVALANPSHAKSQKAPPAPKRFYMKVELGPTWGISMKERGFEGASGTSPGGPYRGKVETGLGATAGFGMGYRISKFFRTEVMANFRLTEWNWKYVPAQSVSTAVIAMGFMTNLYLEAPNFSKTFIPYGVVGVGASHFSMSASNNNNSTTPPPNATWAQTKNKFGWNIGAGARMRYSENVDFEFTYRYVNFGAWKMSWPEGLPTGPGGSQQPAGYSTTKTISANEFLLAWVYKC